MNVTVKDRPIFNGFTFWPILQ